MKGLPRRTALITGASSGIGAAYADRLARRGRDLILVARDDKRLQGLVERITAETGRRVVPFVAQLADAADLRRVEQLIHADASIDMLVNCAGAGAVTGLLDTDVEQVTAMINVNITALTRLSYAAAIAFSGNGHGVIINISSALALATEVLNGVFAASKAYVLAFSQSLQHELTCKDLRVQVVLPGMTATNFWQSAGLHHKHLPTDWLMSAEAVVDAALAGLDAGEFVTLPSLSDPALWAKFEKARQELARQASAAAPAPAPGFVQTDDR